MSEIKLFDTHTHYNSDPLDKEYDSFRKSNDMFINIIGTDLQDSIVAVQQAYQYPNTWCSVGIHPINVPQDLEADLKGIEELIINNPKVICAIGECGLDYHYEGEYDKQEQQIKFRKQIELAIKYQLPLMLHIRDAHEDAIKILNEYKQQLSSIIVHCYTGDYFYAKVYEAMGCYISFPGVLTYKKCDELRYAASQLNINQILTETDAPYLSPVPLRGQQNVSPNVAYTNKCLAEVRNMTVSEINKKLFNNAHLALKLRY